MGFENLSTIFFAIQITILKGSYVATKFMIFLHLPQREGVHSSAKIYDANVEGIWAILWLFAATAKIHPFWWDIASFK